jgi:predicted NBD/HSP70 family sugar kinase
VLGLDAGSSRVTAYGVGLDGEERFRESVPVPLDVAAAGNAAGALLREAMAKCGSPLALTMAVNQVVPHRVRDAAEQRYPRAAQTIEAALKEFDVPDDIPVALENNVNCAAVAEHHSGALRGLPNCAYLQAGIGIGLGFFTEGVLVRGAAGASGELAQIPISWDAAEPSPRDAIEKRYGALGMTERAQQLMGKGAPSTPETILAAAESGDPVAAGIRDEHAIAIARIAIASATVLDPAVLAIGGGLSQNAEFVELIRREFNRHLPHIDFRTAEMKTEATIRGAVIIARDLALTQALGPSHHPLVPHPALWNSPGEAAATGVV